MDINELLQTLAYAIVNARRNPNKRFCLNLDTLQAMKGWYDEITRLRELAAAAYADLCAVHDLPEPWLNAFLAASSGESFTTEGLLPYEPEAPNYLCMCPKCYAVHDNRTLMKNVVIVHNSGEKFAVPTNLTDLREFKSGPYVEDPSSSTACALYEIKGPVR